MNIRQRFDWWLFHIGGVIFAIAPTVLLLASCESRQERAERLVRDCLKYEFTAKQCTYLVTLQLKTEDDAGTVAAISGMALGIAASNSGRR